MVENELHPYKKRCCANNGSWVGKLILDNSRKSFYYV